MGTGRKIGRVRSFFNKIIDFITFVVSWYFAWVIFRGLLESNELSPFLALTGFLGGLLSFLLYKKNLTEFRYLKFPKDKNLKSGYILLFYFVFISFVMSTALTLYVGGFFFENLRVEWLGYLGSLPNILSSLAEESASFLMEVIMGIIINLFVLSVFFALSRKSNKLDNKKMVVVMAGIVFLSTISYLFLDKTFGLTSKLDLFFESNKNILTPYFNAFLTFLLGFAPISWIYELFVAPFRHKGS